VVEVVKGEVEAEVMGAGVRFTMAIAASKGEIWRCNTWGGFKATVGGAGGD
jgi:hypothetical protein